MKMIEIRHQQSVFRYRLDWLNTMEVSPLKVAKGKSDFARLSIIFLEPGVLRSGLSAKQIQDLMLCVKFAFEFTSVDEALAAVTTIDI